MTISHGLRLYCPKGEILAVSKTKGNTLERGSSIVLANLETLSLRIPLVLLNLSDEEIGRVIILKSFQGFH